MFHRDSSVDAPLKLKERFSREVVLVSAVFWACFFVCLFVKNQVGDGESFQGFLRVTLNLIRPITMELGARPPSIYELLTREHIVEQSTQHIAFYMPRDTVKSIHITRWV